MNKSIIVAFLLAAVQGGNYGQAMDEPANYPPSPVDADAAPYAQDPAHVDTNAIAEPDDNTTKADLDQRIATAVKFLQTLQGSYDTQMPGWVINQAKGVVILHCWRGSVLVGDSGGWGIGMEKVAGNFSNPAFYQVEGANMRAVAGTSEINIVAFLMSDKAKKTLTENKSSWAGDLHVITGPHSATATALNADVVLYQKSSGLDAGAIFAAAKFIVDQSSNRIYYGSDLLPGQIFVSNIETSDSVKSLIETLIKLVPAPNGSLSPGAP